MSLYRIFPSKDAYITNRFLQGSTSVRATGSNFGATPTLRIFAIKDDVSSGASELARTLIQFNLTELSGKIFSEKLVPSGSVSYFLKMFNHEHGGSNATSYDLFVYPLSRSWDEGTGKDDDDGSDYGFVNWLSASSTQGWAITGSDYLSTNYGSGSQHFDKGYEDLEVDITQVVNNWLTSSIGQAGGLPNNGLVVKLGTTEEDNSVDYILKMFHGHETIFINKIPYIEARWNDSRKDNRGNFAYNVSSSLYFYNFVRGELTDVTEPVSVRLQDHVIGNSASYNATFTASKIETGIYSASFVVSNTASFSASWVDIWRSGSVVYMSGAFTPLVLTGSDVDQYDDFVLSVKNLKRTYQTNEEARFKVFVGKKNNKYHSISHSASFSSANVQYIEKLYYSILNDATGEVVIPFGTGSLEYTKASYDKDGNYFNLFMNTFIPGFVYRILFLIDINKYDKKVFDNDILFKVI